MNGQKPGDDSPEFHSQRRSRSRPWRRRPDPPEMPDVERVKRRQGRTALAISLAVALFALGGTAFVVLTEQSSPAGNGSALPTGAISVDVVRVIDGDTLDVRSAETTIRVRLYGIDAPEQGEPCYDHATRRLGQLVDTRVSLVSDERLNDRFDRELRYVYGTDGQSIDATMVREGLARAWRDDGSQRAALVALEDQARVARRGCLWAP